MKICPVCRLQAPIDAVFCVQCGHQYRTQFAPPPPPQTQQVPSQPTSFTYSGPIPIPPAPQPPSIWDQFWNPLARSKYEVELLAYMNATGLITDDHKRTAGKYFRFLCVAFAILVAWIVIDSIWSSVRINQEMDRSFRDARESQDRINRMLPR